jgi:hypothetical protein
MVPSRNTILVPSRASVTKQIKVVEALAVVEALETTARATGTKQIKVVEALETTVMSNKIAL